MAELALVGFLGVVSGALIGAIGIGGNALVAALIYVVGLTPQVAVAVSMMGYVFTGAIGTAIYAGKKAIDWSKAGWLALGAAPAALAGAYATNVANPLLVELVIGAFTAAAGLYALFGKDDAESDDGGLSGGVLFVIGAAVGFGSAISGTGGPLLLIPTLLLLGAPILTAIGLGQPIQIPIAILATAGNAAYGTLDVRLGGAAAMGLGLGSYAGAMFAGRLPRVFLRAAVAVVLVLLGAAIISKLAWKTFFGV